MDIIRACDAQARLADPQGLRASCISACSDAAGIPASGDCTGAAPGGGTAPGGSGVGASGGSEEQALPEGSPRAAIELKREPAPGLGLTAEVRARTRLCPTRLIRCWISNWISICHQIVYRTGCRTGCLSG